MGLRLWFRSRLLEINLPIWTGQIVSALPYEMRPGMGRMYINSKRSIREFEDLEGWQKQERIFQRVKKIVEYAEANIPFYTDLYENSGFDPASLKSFDDIKRIPVVNKNKLLSYELSERSNSKRPGYLVNTGGTSGATLGLYIHPDHLGNEWSHMHHIWGKIGFDPKDLKIMLTGRSEFDDGLYYDFVRHSLSISVYTEIDQICGQLKKIIKRYQPKYIHGYPSALYEFALACRENHPDLLSSLRKCLQGGFLGSEFPARLFRETIEDIFQIPTISWYGHTERCILAYEIEGSYEYTPFQTYGFAEVIEDDAGGNTLVGTSYFNQTSPLIRYDTEDQVTGFETEDGVLARFQIKEGRKGEFILDKNGKKIPLTGLIFGRHHELFNYCTHLQIHQKEPGYAAVLFVPINKYNFPDPGDLFDSKNVEIEFTYKMLEEPLRTSAGKVKLIVDEDTFQQ